MEWGEGLSLPAQGYTTDTQMWPLPPVQEKGQQVEGRGRD